MSSGELLETPPRAPSSPSAASLQLKPEPLTVEMGGKSSSAPLLENNDVEKNAGKNSSLQQPRSQSERQLSGESYLSNAYNVKYYPTLLRFHYLHRYNCCQLWCNYKSMYFFNVSNFLMVILFQFVYSYICVCVCMYMYIGMYIRTYICIRCYKSKKLSLK